MRLYSRRVAIGIAALASATLGLLAPSTAMAATGHVDLSSNQQGISVQINGRSVSTKLFGLKLTDGTKLLTYCIDLGTNIVPNAPMIEDNWANYPNTNPPFVAQSAKVNWILHHSYPHKSDLAALATTIGVSGINAQQAIAGTQAAIWHFSNGAVLNPSGNQAKVQALYAYLTGPANVGLGSEPPATLAITPKSATGNAGADIGPFAVETTAAQVALQTDTGTIVDSNGNPITQPVSNGAIFFIRAPANKSGQATVTATATALAQTGRLFRGDGVKTQTLIVATTSETRVSDKATASWTFVPPSSPAPSSSAPSTPAPSSPAPSAPGGGGELAKTGAKVGGIIGASIALLTLGAALVYFARRRRAIAR